MDISTLVSNQHAHFRSGATLPVAARLDALDRLRRNILAMQPDIEAALQTDLGKHPYEGYFCEIGQVLEELSYLRSHLRRWAKPQRVHTPMTLFPAKSRRYPQPYGVVLVMSPWNYPFMLSMTPVLGAIAAGNCVILKPSAYAPATSKVLSQLIAATFEPQYVAVVEGGRAENSALLDQHVDYIFFTGGVTVGKEVMRRAAQNLIPVTLELGGKSPCIVDETADLALAAKRIVFGKFLNAGQTCVAPDYVLVQQTVKDQLVEQLKKALHDALGDAPLSNPEYGKIVNDKHYRRILGLLEGQTILLGGQARDGKIAPTLLDQVDPQSPVMQEEIFGPVLPILSYTTPQEVVDFVSSREKPLALYLFTRSRAHQRQVWRELSFGGGCVNDTVIQLASPRLPFGGVGESGMGAYHGRAGFDAFTHYKSTLWRPAGWEIPLRYPPYSSRQLAVIRAVYEGRDRGAR